MKFSNINNVKGFFEALDNCESGVYLVTEDGDKLNLKSKLTQYIALADALSDTTIGSMELKFDNPDDARHVIGYLTGL